MNTKRNVGILGAPDSGVSEVFEAILRLDETPKPVPPTVITYHEAMWLFENETPYDAKKRKRGLSHE